MKSGIYKILNINDGKCYIGSTNWFVKRFNTHKSKLNNGIHPNIHLQRAWIKSGKDNFQFLIIEKCEIDLLSEREQYFIDTIKPEYNFCPNARSSRGRYISDETRIKMSIAQIGHSRNIGRKCTMDEIKRKADNLRCSVKTEKEKSKIGYKNSLYERTEQHLKKLSENSTNKRKIAMMDSVTFDIIKEFDSVLSAKQYVGAMTHTGIQKCCAGQRKKAFGFSWKYIEDKQKIIVLDCKKELIGEFNSFTDVASNFKKSRTYIKKCFNDNIPDYDGNTYKYKYESNYITN